jgi:cobalt/nickel transport protein
MTEKKVPFFDSFTRNVLIVGFVLLLAIFGSAYYMDLHKMEAGGTDDVVNNMGATAMHVTHHPLVDLPGDAQVGAFSVANFMAGLIVGHSWHKLFEKDNKEEVEG